MQHRWAWLALGLALGAGCRGEAAPLQHATTVGRHIAWDAKKDGDPKTYRVSDLRITLSSSPPAKAGDRPAPTLTVTSPRFGRAAITGKAGFDVPAAEFAVAKLDPKADGPAVILTSYSGGAHCCTGVLILDPVGGRWRRVDGGEMNDGPALPPKDLDGDGTPDLLLEDENFLYAFACYACASAPPRIVDVIGGVWTDVSKAPRFARVFDADAARVKTGCADSGGQNGLCAAYVADEARLGRFDAAWAYMLAHYNKTDDWVLPTGCRVPHGAQDCPKDQQIVYKTYPEALRAFLIDHGYIQAGAAAAPH